MMNMLNMLPESTKLIALSMLISWGLLFFLVKNARSGCFNKTDYTISTVLTGVLALFTGFYVIGQCFST